MITRPCFCGDLSTLARLAESAALLGAGWVRLLARSPLTVRELAGAAALPALAGSPLPLLVELHDPGWMDPGCIAGLAALMDSCPAMGLLADTAPACRSPPRRCGTVLGGSRSRPCQGRAPVGFRSRTSGAWACPHRIDGRRQARGRSTSGGRPGMDRTRPQPGDVCGPLPGRYRLVGGPAYR